jgi:DNA-binding NarL/FixJ family response regulator
VALSVKQAPIRITAPEPDAVLIDTSLPEDRLESWLDLVRQAPHVAKTILLCGDSSPETLRRLMRFTVNGILDENATIEEVQQAISKVLDGETFCSGDILSTLFQTFSQVAETPVSEDREDGGELTPREMEVLQLVEAGWGNKQIARRLSISPYTVKNHVHNIVQKLKAGNRHEAAARARQGGLLEGRRADDAALASALIRSRIAN